MDSIDYRAEYYKSFVNRWEAEEFRAVCHFSQDFWFKYKDDKENEFKHLLEEWHKKCERDNHKNDNKSGNI